MPASAPPPSVDPTTLRPAPLGLADLGGALRFGLAQFRAIPLLSMAFALLFVAIGALLFGILEFGAIAPMSLSLAGGFMLVGPILLAGFFAWRAWDIKRACIPMVAMPISPSSSAFGTRAATESTTMTSSALERASVSQMVRASSPESGCETSKSFRFTPSFLA